MSHAAFARITPADRARIRAAFRFDHGNRKRRAVIVVGSAALAVAAMATAVVALGNGGILLGAIVAAGLGAFAAGCVWLDRRQMFQGFAGSGLTAAERASVLHMLRTDDAYADERDAS